MHRPSLTKQITYHARYSETSQYYIYRPAKLFDYQAIDEPDHLEDNP